PDRSGHDLDLVNAIGDGERDGQGPNVPAVKNGHPASRPQPSGTPQVPAACGSVDRYVRDRRAAIEPPELRPHEEASVWRLIARPHETPLASSEPAIETRPQLLDDPGGASLDGQRDAPAAVETVEHDLAVAKRGERAAAVLPQEMPTRADRTVRLPRVVDGRLAAPRGE